MNVKQQLRKLVAAREACETLAESLVSEWPGIVRAILDRDRISLRDLAERMDLSPTYLSLIGSGKVPPSPRSESLLMKEFCRNG